MFEITISTARNTEKDISFIINKLRPNLKSMKAILVCEDFDGRVNLAMAVNEHKKDLLISLVFDAISESVVRNYKERFLLKNINIDSVDELTKVAFVKALTLFDKESDKAYIKSRLEPFKELALDSFYNFKLWLLEKRWGEIASLVSENSNYLIMSGAFKELMKYLIVTNDVEFGELHLYYENEKIIAKDKDNKNMFTVDYLGKEKDKIKVISEIISLSPQKIVLHSGFLGLDVSSFLENLYESRVSVLK